MLSVLRAVQKELGDLPSWALAEVALKLGMTPAEVQGVAEFYGFLSERGPYRLSFSTCIVDEFQGRGELQDRLCEKLKLSPGKVRADGLVGVYETSCTGLCARS